MPPRKKVNRKRTCSVKGCERPFVARNFCANHYAAWRYHGGNQYVPRPPRGTCTIKNCNRPHVARGYCNTHYSRWLLHGDANHVAERPRGRWGATRMLEVERVILKQGIIGLLSRR